MVNTHARSISTLARVTCGGVTTRHDALERVVHGGALPFALVGVTRIPRAQPRTRRRQLTRQSIVARCTDSRLVVVQRTTVAPSCLFSQGGGT